MKRLVPAVTCLLGMLPAAASAALDLRVGPNRGPEAVDAVVAPGSGEQFFDLAFTETGTPYNEGLWAYDVMVRSPRPGITLLRAERPDNWVITDANGTFTVFDSGPGHLLFGASNSDRLSDITTGRKAARIFYSVDAGAAPGLYNLTLDREWTVFVSGEPVSANRIVVDITDPGVIRVTPEPAGLALIGAVAVFALRRRRNA